MLIFICAFLPPAVSVGIYEKLAKTDLSVKRWIYLYSFACVVVNLFSWVMLRWQRGYYFFEPYATDTLLYYMVFVMAAAIALPVFAALLKKTVEIRVENDDEKKK